MSPSARPRFTRKPAVEIDIVRESPLWENQPCSEEMIRRAIAEASNVSGGGGELAIVLSDDSRIRSLNRVWRGIDKPTNVLSFPSSQHGKRMPGGGMLGDIVIAYETTAREAAAQQLPFLHHLAHLAVHGFLHLQGHDHETEDDAEKMECRERAILARLDIADPYAARDSAR
ncbi:MAG TPA: rRNA maturation RNase YbeY [Xanthobacteraceae bacterium]|nr:rRNA maturation RNase YbeY [Xanthobacteraceae bacterium]